MRTILIPGVPLLAILLTSCSEETKAPTANVAPLLASAPAAGSGGKQVFAFDFELPPVDCGSQVLNARLTGWAQMRVFEQSGNRNVSLSVFHGVWTFTNASGATFVWRDVGPDHVYVQNGNLFLSIVGTSTASGTPDRDQVVIGRVVLNLSTNEAVFEAGNSRGTITNLACEALT